MFYLTDDQRALQARARHLADSVFAPRAADIDFVVLRECTEGLFASVGKGEVIEDREARETLVITRPTCEKFFDFGFKLAQKRKERGAKGLVTCVDKSNVFRAYAFFRKIFDERAALFPDIKINNSFFSNFFSSLST